MKNIFILFTLLSFLCSFACTTPDNKTAEATTDNTATSAEIPEEYSNSPADAQEVFSWVENLNIRQQANKKSKAVATAKENQKLFLTGNKSDFSETIELRGKTYTEPWVEVKTEDGIRGWVFAGAIKSKGESKGNALNTPSKFTYPHFGSIDLSEWEKFDSSNLEEGDATIITNSYHKENRILEIYFADLGEYGWTKTYELLNPYRRILKERSISYSPEMNTDTETYSYLLKESVKDYTNKPGKEYSRTNVLKKALTFDADKSEIATGNWQTKNIERQKWLEPFTAQQCATQAEKDFDCTCTFKTGDPYKGPTFFASDWDEDACVKIKGQLNSLTPDWEERDYEIELKKLADSKTWISVKNKSILYFGKPLVDYKYEDPIELLTDVILASGKKLNKIPLQSTISGANLENVKTQTQKAIAKANDYRKKGGDNPLSIRKFNNRSFDVFVRYRQITQSEGEANQYEGKVILLQHRGMEILDAININGTCGC